MSRNDIREKNCGPNINKQSTTQYRCLFIHLRLRSPSWPFPKTKIQQINWETVDLIRSVAPFQFKNPGIKRQAANNQASKKRSSQTNNTCIPPAPLACRGAATSTLRARPATADAGSTAIRGQSATSKELRKRNRLSTRSINKNKKFFCFQGILFFTLSREIGIGVSSV